MSLRIKSIKELLSNLVVNVTTRTKMITDFNPGSATRTLLEATALQLEEFYFDMRQNIEYAIENAIYNAFGFDRVLQTKATGYVTIEFVEPLPNPMIIPMKSLFSTSLTYNKVTQFISTEDIVAEKGALSTKVPVECTQPGTIGNVDAYKIVLMVASSSLINNVGNEGAFTNGVDEETSSERKSRFKEYIKSLSKATVESIAYGAKEVDGVTGVWVDDHYIGFVRVYVHNKDGNLSDELKAKVLKNLDNYRAGGVEVEVLPIVKKPVNLTMLFILKDGLSIDDYVLNIRSTVVDYLNNFEVARSFYITDLIGAVTEAYKDILVTFEIKQGEDVITQPNELITSGILDITGINLKDWGK